MKHFIYTQLTQHFNRSIRCPRKVAFKDYDHHQEKGGLASMGETLKRGMVLSVSIWDDYSTHMAWLDASFPPGEDPEERRRRHSLGAPKRKVK